VALCQLANDTFLELSRTYPERFRVFASVPLHFPDEAMRELERVGHEPAVVGVVLGANCNHEPLDRPDFLPFYAELERRGLPIFIHPMCAPGAEAMQDYGLAPMAGYLFDSTLAVLRLVFTGVFERHPGLTLIMPHLGAVAPYMLGRVWYAYDRHPRLHANISEAPEAYFRRFYYDTVSRSVPALRFASELFGADHLVLGTDFPFWTDIEGIYQDILDMGLSAEAVAGIFAGNALRALPRLNLISLGANR
jgi:predicted TIM-barrel fold metal-dependent hydrolase